MATTMEQEIDVTRGARVLQCVVVTPEATVLQTSAQFVALPLYDGEIGLAPGRAPMIGRLGYGEMRVVEGDRTTRWYIDGGFVQVVGNTVSVLTSRAISADDLDADVAAEQLLSALDLVAHSADRMAVRDRAITRARAQLHVARRAK